MIHLRTQVRAALQSLIVAAATDAGTNVFTGRVYPLAEDGPWPQVTITSAPEGETVRVASMGGIGMRIQERTYHVDIAVHAKDATDPETIADACALQIEKAMANDITLSGACKFHSLIACRTELSGAGETPAVSLAMLYAITLMAREGSPDVLS
jgi:hypothetical protein